MKIPRDWELVQLSRIADKIMVGIASAATHAYSDSGVRMLRNLNIKEGWIDDSDILHIDEKYEKTHKNKRLKAGDILTVRTGYPGVSAVVPSQYEGAQCFTSLITRLNKDKALPEYVCIFINSEYGKKFIVSGEAGGAQKNVNAGMLQKMPVPLPTLAEQKKIAQILSTWDKAITTTEQLLANSQQQKKALMQQLLAGKKRLLNKDGVRFSGERASYRLEELEELGWVELGRGNVISKKDIDNIPGEYPIYSSSIKNNGLMGKYGEYMFDEELISWSVDGGGNFFYRPKHKFSVTNVSGYMRLDSEKLNYRFIAAQLELHHSRLEFDYQSKAHPSVIRKAYTLTIPSLDEQKKIAAVLCTADQKISALQQNLDILKQEKKALMQQLLTGKRRVKAGS